MIIVDTSVWFDHFRGSEPALVELLTRNDVAGHPLVVGELAMGSITNRVAILASMKRLPTVVVASHNEVLSFVEAHRLFGRGLSFVDAHLLSAVLLTPGTLLWTRDKRLRAAAAQLGVAAPDTLYP